MFGMKMLKYLRSLLLESSSLFYSGLYGHSMTPCVLDLFMTTYKVKPLLTWLANHEAHLASSISKSLGC